MKPTQEQTDFLGALELPGAPGTGKPRHCRRGRSSTRTRLCQRKAGYLRIDLALPPDIASYLRKVAPRKRGKTRVLIDLLRAAVAARRASANPQ